MHPRPFRRLTWLFNRAAKKKLARSGFEPANAAGSAKLAGGVEERNLTAETRSTPRKEEGDLGTRIATYCCLVLLASVSASSQERVVQLDWIFVSHPLRWESPPRTLHLGIKTAAADLIVLYPTGQFAGVSCLLIKGSNGFVSISRGDGEIVRIGKWLQKGNTIQVKSQIVYRTGPIIGRAIPEDEVTEQFKRSAKDRLRSSGWEYVALQRFSDLEYLDGLIRCDRSGWDGHGQRRDFVPPCMSSQ